MSVTRVVIVALAIVASVFLYMYFTNQLGGPSPWSRIDANPTPENLQRWIVKDFHPQGWKLWNNNPSLEYPRKGFDTGRVYNTNRRIAPWGKQGWGIKAYSWKEGSGERPIEFHHFRVIDGKIYLSVKQEDGYYGNGTIIQGWNWGGHVPWRCPPKITVCDKKIVSSINFKVSGVDTGGFWSLDSWLMIATTYWFRSPDLPKPLVIDLAFYINRDVMFSHESDAYHYQKMVVKDKDANLGKWQHYDIDLSWFIDDSIKRYKLPDSIRENLTLQSMEMLVEGTKTGASIWVDNFALYYKDK